MNPHDGPQHPDDSRHDDGRPRDEGPEDEQSIPMAQWAVGAVSTLVVLGLLAFIVYEAVTTPDLPVVITLQAEHVAPAGQGYVVGFTARNDGGTTVHGLQVQGTLYAETAEVESASATVRWVPAGTHRKGGLFFQHDPRRYRLALQPKGYDIP